MHQIFTLLNRFLAIQAIIFLLLLGSFQQLYAQCSNDTPVFKVDLTGKPNGEWHSTNIKRSGTCCDADKNQTCVQFEITLDKLSGGLQFDITTNPKPAGAMTYRIGCEPPVPVGDSICVTGPGPHKLSICMPGGASNTFVIRSIAAYEPVTDANITGGCSTTLNAPIAFDPATVEWNDITGGGIYNSYLSCTSGCGTTTITPDTNPPAYVDYTICGNSQAAVCTSLPYCDTVRVYFHPPITASINPDPAIICPGSGSVELVGSATGGSGYYDYFWFDGAGNLLANAQKYNATAIGTYKLEVRNENYPNCTPFTSSVTVTENLSANAGPDQEVCANGTVQLAGSVTAATGGIWSGGAGTFSPDATRLNAVYTPTADEAAAGRLSLTLTTTGNGSCSPVSDEVIINFHSFDVAITAPASICTGSSATLSANVTGGLSPFTYLWNSGETAQSISNKPAGTYSVAVTDSKNCTFESRVTITEEAGPTDFTAASSSSTCGNSNGEIVIGSVSGGTSPYTYSKDGTSFQTSNTFSGLLAATYPITVKDANGCTFAKNVLLENTAGPTDFTTLLTSSSCGGSNGQIEISTVTGGTSPYTYSKDGTTFQTSTKFSGLPAGTYAITVKDANGCTTSKSVPLTNENGPTAVSATSQPASCTNDNGKIDIISVSGGISPYTYSINGTTFQTSTSFTGLASGNYTVTAKDKNGCIITTSTTVAKVQPTDLAASLTPSSCGSANGKIEISSVTGGVAPYTYSKDATTFQNSGTFSNLLAGDYTITVKDANGCTYAELFKLTDKSGPTAMDLTQSSSSCGRANGTINVTMVTGGTNPHSYSKDRTTYQTSSTFSNLLAGDYTITVRDANGCTFARGITVTDIPGPSDMTFANTSSTCGNPNGEISVSVITGGTSPYTYSKDGTTFQTSNTFTGLMAGTYTITVKDGNGCDFSKETSISNIPGPTGFTTVTTSSTCGKTNGKIEVTSTTGGTAPYIYAINNGSYQGNAMFSGLAAGVYTISIKDANGCVISKDVPLNNIAGPSAVSAGSQAATCSDNDGSITVGSVTGGTSPYSYSINGTTFQSGTNFTALASGTYTLTAKDANGCMISTSVTVVKAEPTDLTAILTPSSCGGANGQIEIKAVTGGVAPFTYSIDGNNYQGANTFNELMESSYTLRVKDANGCLYSEGVVLTDIPGPSAMSLSQTTSTCSLANGKIDVTAVTGGTAPYTYSIDGTAFQTGTSFSNLLAGDYKVIVKDANACTIAKDITVTNVAGPSDLSLTTTSSICSEANGKIDVTAVTGGTAPYNYSIDGLNFGAGTSFSNLLAGTYEVAVKDAAGCLFVKGITVKDLAGPSDFTATTTSSTCGDPNGQISISGIVNGTTPYSYSADGVNFQASSTLSGLVAGTYTVVVKDANGCSFSKEVILNDIAGPGAVSAGSQPASCADNDGSIAVTSVTGGTSPYTYSIDGTTFQSATTFTALASGTYTLSAKDENGCIISSPIVVEKLGPTDLTFTTQSSNCGASDGSFTVSGVTGGITPYSYSLNGSSYQESSTFGNLNSGTYTAWVKDANGCTYSEEVSINDIGGATGISPSLKQTTCGLSNGAISISDITGGTSPFTISLNGGAFTNSASFSNLIAGIYTIQVKDANGCLYTEEVELKDHPGPSDISISTAFSTCGNANGSLTVNAVTSGTAPYKYSINGTTYQTSASFSGLLAGTYAVTVKDFWGCTYREEAAVIDIPGPTDISLSSTTATCSEANGSLTVESVSGGSEHYSYSVDGTNFQNSNIFESLPAGTYEVTAKDLNGCLIRKSITINDIAGPSAAIISTQSATCADNNGAIEVGSVTGGATPYSFSIDGTNFQSSTSFSGLASGKYVVITKDANGCTLSTEATIGRIEPTDLLPVAAASTCGNSNGSINISSVSGGVSPYTYSIGGTNFQPSSEFTGLATGTYTMVVKDANGCTYSEKVVLEDIAGPTDMNISLNSSSCGRTNGSITVSAVTGGTSPYSYSIDGKLFQENATFINLAAGTYTLTVKDANACSFTEEVVLEDIAGPADLTLTATSSTCSSANGTIAVSEVTGGSSPYTYSIDGTTFQSETSFGSLLAGTYEVTVKDANGCTYSKEVIVQDIAGPDALEASSTPATCGEADGSIEAGAVNGGTGPYTYSLNGGAYQAETTFSGIAAGEHLLRAKDANSCVIEKSVQLSNIGGPTDLTATSTAAICGASNGSLSVTNVEGSTGPYNYSIDGTNFQASEYFTSLEGGTYSVTVKDINGCLYLETVEVQDESSPSGITASTTPTSCSIDNGTITIESVNGGKSPFSYSLDGENFQNRTTFSALTAATYTIYVKDANGCVATFEETVITTGPQDAEITVTNASCGESDGGFVVESVSGGITPYSYSIDGINYQAATSFSTLEAGSYTLSIKDDGGCVLLLPVNISNNGGPEDFTLTISNASCGSSNGSIEFSEPTGGTAPYSYSIDGSDYQTGTSFSGLAEGDYQLSAKDANGCLLFKTATITNTKAPSGLQFTYTPESCGEKNASITVEGVTGGNAPYSYSLNGIDFQEATTFTALKSGSKVLYVKDKNGCVYSEYFEIEGTEGPTDFDFSTKDSGCEADGEILVSEVIGGTGPYSYSIDGTTYQENAEFTQLAGNSYIVYVKDANNCIISKNAFISTPGFTVIYKSDISCYGEDNGMIALEAPLTYNPEFSIDGGETFQSQPLFSNLKKGNYNVIGRFGTDCLFEIKNIGIREPDSLWAVVTPTAKAMGNIQSGSAEISQFKGGIPPYEFALNSGDFGPDTVFNNLKGGKHVIFMLDASGCSREFPFVIEHIQDIEIPNSFTPNGDGINDTWVLRNISVLYPQCKVAVFNRWGQEVFQSTGYSNEWNGTNKGKSLPDGTYYFIVQLNGTEAPIKGSLTIMR